MPPNWPPTKKRTGDRCSELLKTHPEFPLHQAAAVGDTPDVLDQFLLVLKVPIDAKDTSCITPLHFATLNGHTTIVEYLLTEGAEINVKDNRGRTPLHFAAGYGHPTTVEHLLTKGAEINVKDSMGMTPLHWAAHKGREDVVALLQTKGGTK